MTRGRGFTLVEILVVLVITSLVVGLLFQGMGQVMQLQSRAGEMIARSQQGAMIEDWFRQSLQGIQPDYDDGGDKFAGSERRMSGLTTNALAADYGTMAPFIWKIAYDSQRGVSELIYDEGRGGMPILAWQGDSGHFVYIDAEGESHDAWPPPMGQKWPQLPAVIRFETVENAVFSTVNGAVPGWIIVAVPRGPQQPPVRVKDILGGK